MCGFGFSVTISSVISLAAEKQVRKESVKSVKRHRYSTENPEWRSDMGK